jgi:hypothetical protein
MSEKTLWKPVVDDEKLNNSFKTICKIQGSAPARQMLDDVYQDFNDADGNFLEQFQTTGFNSRYFELYLFAYFSRSGYQVDRTYENPDFLVTRNGLTVAVEATTVNPSQSGTMSRSDKKFNELTYEEKIQFLREVLPIRFGSPLFSKLKKRYWEKEHCRDVPFVIAIEAFHEKDSLLFADTSLSGYLYGIWQTGSWTKKGKLNIDAESIEEHKVENKKIPSNFFSQPDTEHISAVVFTNSGTHAKLLRMGYQHGYGCDVIDMTRIGNCFNPDPDAMDPSFFIYNLDEPPFVEPWGQGLVVLHNPNSLHPIPRDYFIDAVQGYVEDGTYATDHHGWHPINSKTMSIYLGEAKKKLSEALPRNVRILIRAIPKKEFQSICVFSLPDDNPMGEEKGWFADESYSFLGVVVQDKTDQDWGWAIFGRDEHFLFRIIEWNTSLSTRYSAIDAMQRKMVKLASSPKRIFPVSG